MIEVQGLTKYFGDRAAIQDLTFSISQGEVIGFLGLNGAGKSTTLRILGCVLVPTSGKVVIDDVDIAEDPHAVRERIGFLPETPPLYPEMTVGAYLKFAAELRGVPGREAAKCVEEAEEKTDLRQVHHEYIGSLSHGYRQRVGLAQALVHSPALLILDEPTSGLDPVQIVEMRNLIRNLRGEHTILLSSHILSEISQTCDRLLVIQQGRIVAQGSEQDLAHEMGDTGSVELEVAGPADAAVAVLSTIEGIRRVTVLREENGVVALRLAAPLSVRPQVARNLVHGGLDLLRMDRGASQLESIFLQLTRPGTEAS